MDKTCKLLMMIHTCGAVMQDQPHKAFLEAMQYNYGSPSNTSKPQTSRAWSCCSTSYSLSILFP